MKKKPVLTAVYDDENGEGFIRMDRSFLRETPLMRADVLKDVLYEITEFYNDAVTEAFRGEIKLRGRVQ